MTLLRTYIVLAVLRGVATVMAVLVVVTCVIEFVGQLNDVGTGDYGLQTALAYIALRIPRTIFITLPRERATRQWSLAPETGSSSIFSAGTSVAR